MGAGVVETAGVQERQNFPLAWWNACNESNAVGLHCYKEEFAPCWMGGQESVLMAFVLGQIALLLRIGHQQL